MRILIAIIVLLGLASVIAVIYFGEHTFEGIVVEHPYEQGLAWDRVRKEKSALGWAVDLSNKQFKQGDNELVLSVHDKDGSPLRGAKVSVIVSRPATACYDRRYETVGFADGLYRSAVSFPLRGQWDVRVEVSRNGNTVVFDQRIFAEKEAS
ncbi:MAG: FixH family protein [Thermodesulfovibrionales bacterium]|jgi:nitrogen fixation protein FixH